MNYIKTAATGATISGASAYLHALLEAWLRVQDMKHYAEWASRATCASTVMLAVFLFALFMAIIAKEAP